MCLYCFVEHSYQNALEHAGDDVAITSVGYNKFVLSYIGYRLDDHSQVRYDYPIDMINYLEDGAELSESVGFMVMFYVLRQMNEHSPDADLFELTLPVQMDPGISFVATNPRFIHDVKITGAFPRYEIVVYMCVNGEIFAIDKRTMLTESDLGNEDVATARYQQVIQSVRSPVSICN